MRHNKKINHLGRTSSHRHALLSNMACSLILHMFGDVAQKIANRPGGYTRILKLGNRLGDNAEMCMIELVDYNTTYTEVKKEEAKKTTRRRRPSAKKEAAPAATEETQVAEAPVTEEAPKAE